MTDIYAHMYTDIWNFHHKYISHISSSDSFWNAVRDDALKIGHKYKEHPFIVALIMNELNEFERLYK